MPWTLAEKRRGGSGQTQSGPLRPGCQASKPLSALFARDPSVGGGNRTPGQPNTAPADPSVCPGRSRKSGAGARGRPVAPRHAHPDWVGDGLVSKQTKHTTSSSCQSSREGRLATPARAWGPARVQEWCVWRPTHSSHRFICGHCASSVDALCAAIPSLPRATPLFIFGAETKGSFIANFINLLIFLLSPAVVLAEAGAPDHVWTRLENGSPPKVFEVSFSVSTARPTPHRICKN